DLINRVMKKKELANLIDHNGYSFNKEELNLSAFIRLLLQKLPGANQRNRIDGQIEDGISIFADRNAISVLFSNLLENAIKYSPADSTIRITLVKDRGQARLQFIDEGIGVPAAEKKNIFRKFYRIGKEETRKTKGTGLGLYIVKYIIDEHGGDITVADNTPKGSIFDVHLPISKTAGNG
ncbi:MAG TPA: ATP-binding protein, partial [Bacteroidia bacterium]|nr:ATP-binding protein [Bacteroidia bacterium]